MNALKFIDKWDSVINQWRERSEEFKLNVKIEEKDFDLLTYTKSEKTDAQNDENAYKEKWLQQNIDFMS